MSSVLLEARAVRAPARRVDPVGAAMVALAAIACLAVVVLLATILWLSFTEGMPGDPALGYTATHYRDVLLDPFTYRVLGNTAVFAALALAVALLCAVPIAWLMERTDFPGKPAVYTLMTVALLIPGFAVALGWVFLLHPRIGLVNQALMGLLGLARPPFNVATIPVMGAVEGLSLAPLAFIMVAVVLRAMDPALEDAAAIAGARPVQVAFRVTLRVLWPGLLAAAIYVLTIGFAAFDVPAILGLTARIFTFSTYVFSALAPTDGPPEYGDVATLSVIMVALALGLSAAYRAAQRQAPKYAVVTGKAYRPRLQRLGRWRGPAAALVALYFVLAQLLPLTVLAWAALLPYLQTPSAAALRLLTVRNFTGLPRALVLHAIGNTAVLMVTVPTVTLVLSLAVSWVVLRTRIRFRGAFEFLAFLPLAVPAIVFSVAALLLALFVLRGVAPLYGTIWLLVLVYVVARLSYGTRMTNGALIQIHRELEESAAISGAGTGGVLRRILMPLLAPALLYAWIWIALLSYRELSLPVVLATSGNLPFSFLVWGYVQASSYGSASAAALVMLALLAPVLFLYWIVARRAGMIAPR